MIYSTISFILLLCVASSQWTTLAAQGTYLSGPIVANRVQFSFPFYDIGQSQFNSLFQAASCPIIRRQCSGCVSSHQVIYYRRITDQATFEPWTYFLDNWMIHRNELNIDFELYSNLQDAQLRNIRNRWIYCDFNDGGVGFPRDCAPSSITEGQWNSFYSKMAKDSSGIYGQSNVIFDLYTGNQCDSTLFPNILALQGNFYSNRYGINFNEFGYGPAFYSRSKVDFNNVVQSASTINNCGWVIIRRECKNCDNDHSDMYYKRLKDFNFDYHEYLLTNWQSLDNGLHYDFDIYSTLTDAIYNNNYWQQCNYDDPNGNVGFPRDCGVTSLVASQWNTYYSTRSGGQSDTMNPKYIIME